MKITNFKEDRFCIIDENQKIIDDANEYGYKSYDSALRAMNFKFNGGKEKAENLKSQYLKWKNDKSIEYKILRSFSKYCDACCKELSRKETSYNDLFDYIERDLQIEISKEDRKIYLKFNKLN